MTTKMDKSTGKASPETTNKLGKIVRIVSKVMEVTNWIAAAMMIVVVIFTFSHGEWLQSAVDITEGSDTLNIYGFQAQVVKDGVINYDVLGWFSIASVLIMGIMAMIFRNIYLITKNSQDSTPFQPDNVRMLKELGIFFIAMPVVGMIFNMIIFLITGVETDVHSEGVLIGLIMLYLTQLFAHGVALEDDVKGLV